MAFDEYVEVETKNGKELRRVAGFVYNSFSKRHLVEPELRAGEQAMRCINGSIVIVEGPED